jgi:hypothetical protein
MGRVRNSFKQKLAVSSDKRVSLSDCIVALDNNKSHDAVKHILDKKRKSNNLLEPAKKNRFGINN